MLKKDNCFVYAPEQWQQDLLNSGLSWSAKHTNFTPWIAQTYGELAKIGINLKVSKTLFVDGIILADRDTLGYTLEYTFPFLDKTLLICAKSDSEFHASADFHVTHNRTDESRFLYNIIWKPRYIPHWTIPDIKPRDLNRGNKLENVAYIGSKCQLAEELKTPEWERKVQELGLNWMPLFDPRLWNDYTNIDLIIAARKFPSPPYYNKGAIKLFNCWQAGVPALLAPESAFMAERNSEYDFLPINSFDEAYSQLKFLKLNPEFYTQMLRRSQERIQTINQECIRNKWLQLFEEVEDFYEHWKGISKFEKKAAFLMRRYALKQSRLSSKIAKAFPSF